MDKQKKICVECGKYVEMRNNYILCDHCRNVIMMGYDPEEKYNEVHTSDYYNKPFKQINANLLEECRRADACGKSYGYYKADNRRILKDGIH